MSPLKQRFETELETIMGGLDYKRKKGSLTFTKQISANVSWTVFFQTLPSYPIGEKITYIPRVGIRYKDVDLIMLKTQRILAEQEICVRHGFYILVQYCQRNAATPGLYE